jgi:hypothetical protein
LTDFCFGDESLVVHGLRNGPGVGVRGLGDSARSEALERPVSERYVVFRGRLRRF